MNEKTVELQTRMYLYDLMNAAKEHGFKADDSWELNMVTDSGRSKLQKDYYPAIAMKILPEMLLQVFNSTKSGLKQSSANEGQVPDKKSILTDNINYLVAINPKRPRG
ncbi:hypothetical protein [Mucilaginibacter sp.]|jgi:hypothetical protein|uniref:hypothetical protein n=1 Tax=Mucilaginibacter sp. TaxID=1882438 RepID=UPI0026331BF6|nr:hypothetical protein [Mucilaginibacter sp.]MDB4920610.1 hypothetical protein [Mucilaginibacter sp.]